MADGEDNLPKDAKMIKRLLESMGVHEYEPRVVRQFLELFYRNAVDLLMDAKTYSNHAEKPCIDVADVNLAIQSKPYFSFTDPPLPEVINAVEKLNKKALPRPSGGQGSSLPPERDTLIVSNYLLHEIQKKQSSEVVEVVDVDEKPQHEQRTNMPPNRRQRVSFPKPAQEQKRGNSSHGRVSFPLGRKPEGNVYGRSIHQGLCITYRES